jgi:branched-chain amino acid aminotransferase
VNADVAPFALVHVDGEFVRADHARVSVFDRSFLYGDGLFSTLRVYGGRLFSWAEHLQRLHRGADALRLVFPWSDATLGETARELLRLNRVEDALLRLHISRGIGRRGYSPRGADHPLIVMSLHPLPVGDPQRPVQLTLVTASARLPAGDELAHVKPASRLLHILARAEAEARGANEALMLNTLGHVAEAASANLFWIESMSGHQNLFTPPLTAGVLAGVARTVVCRLSAQLGLSCREVDAAPDRLSRADGVFLTSSAWEVAPVLALDGRPLPQDAWVERLWLAYRALATRSTAEGPPVEPTA